MIENELSKELEEQDFPWCKDYTVSGTLYKQVDEISNCEEHRWANTTQFILEDPEGNLFQILYDFGSTETQENGFIYNEAKITPVEKKTRSQVYYEVVEK